ncbi:hypothetical protein BDN70DRAFT_944532 [Pholiota conissans]|uniref:Protein kinase domain-containing protein n=1 Tax=Pholiota conissans TaxID=109636 RepID=A0A9P5YZJ6_9AGAR|nr:hypothetical protein BDN70DRAFT_944532 [Pholiota conissans]
MLNFRLSRRLKFPSYWPTMGVDPKQPKQRLSPTPYTLENLTAAGSHSFVAKDSLYVGPERWSQVYGGSLSLPNAKVQNDLVLKIFNSSLLPFANIDANSEDWKISGPQHISHNSYRYTDELMAWAEVHAYSKLVSLQGTVVPRLVGAFMVQYPESDEEHIAIAMTRIRGNSFMDRCRKLGCEIDGDERWYPLALELMRRIYDIHQLGIIGLDIRDENIFVVDAPDAASSPSIKLFDFGFSRPNQFEDPEDKKKHAVAFITMKDVGGLTTLLLDTCGGDSGRPEWLVENGFTLEYRQRRWDFFQWIRREHPEEPFLSEWWDKYLSRTLPPPETGASFF